MNNLTELVEAGEKATAGPWDEELTARIWEAGLGQLFANADLPTAAAIDVRSGQAATDGRFAGIARNAMPELEELLTLQREAFDPETSVTRLMKIRQRIRELVGAEVGYDPELVGGGE